MQGGSPSSYGVVNHGPFAFLTAPVYCYRCPIYSSTSRHSRNSQDTHSSLTIIPDKTYLLQPPLLNAGVNGHRGFLPSSIKPSRTKDVLVEDIKHDGFAVPDTDLSLGTIIRRKAVQYHEDPNKTPSSLTPRQRKIMSARLSSILDLTDPKDYSSLSTSGIISMHTSRKNWASKLLLLRTTFVTQSK